MELSHILPQKTLIIVFAVIIFYFVFISFTGIYFSRFSSNINDFFFSGQRFSWWLPAFSMVATGIGSYSYLKYSEQGFSTGMSSTMVYMNEWFVLPVFVFAWLPVLYYNRIKSVPEYFERRFNRTARYVAVILILAYIFYYISYNLYTIGLALDGLFGFSPIYTVPIVTFILGFYVTFGGQTAVILTDLFQGLMLYLAGFLVVGFGIYALGGIEEFWSYLPLSHRLPFASLNADPYFNSVGVFWGDALVGSAAFLFMNQGILMRFLSIRSVKQARITALFNVLVCLPLSALTVGVAGWIAKSIITKQESIGSALSGYEALSVTDTYSVFINVAFEVLKQQELLLGLVIAALLAALMSTVDTLINASAAIGVYDIYKPLIRPNENEKHYLRVARGASALVIGISLLLVIWFFRQKGTLMSIHYKGIMTIIPPVVITVFIALFWRRFDALSAILAMVVGGATTVLTGIFPEPVLWLRAFFMGAESGDPIYFRAVFGSILTGVIGVTACLTRPLWSKKDHVETPGLTADTLDKAMSFFKGGAPNLEPGQQVKKLKLSLDSKLNKEEIGLSQKVCDLLKAKRGDQIYVSDNRWWLGGIRSGHFVLKDIYDDGDDKLLLFISEEGVKRAYMLLDRKVFLEKII
ncbi:MAG: sodium:solute symporter family protein [Bdellovibrionales bacterium]|nr:sodium:solute symporter family protein [Bdellovibrionales bacterium]